MEGGRGGCCSRDAKREEGRGGNGGDMKVDSEKLVICEEKGKMKAKGGRNEHSMGRDHNLRPWNLTKLSTNQHTKYRFSQRRARSAPAAAAAAPAPFAARGSDAWERSKKNGNSQRSGAVSDVAGPSVDNTARRAGHCALASREKASTKRHGPTEEASQC
eukprot:2499875-Pleurochrysis_carterae.AAC.1